MQNRDYVNYKHIKPVVEIPTKGEIYGWTFVAAGVSALVVFVLGAF